MSQLDLTPIQDALSNAVGECPHCRVDVLVNLLAFEIVAATFPGRPHDTIARVSSHLGTLIGVATRLRTETEQATCAGRA